MFSNWTLQYIHAVEKESVSQKLLFRIGVCNQYEDDNGNIELIFDIASQMETKRTRHPINYKGNHEMHWLPVTVKRFKLNFI